MNELKSPTWDANLYLKFVDHRLRPALDLMGRLDPANGARPGHAIYDLGCGAGNITRILAERFAKAPVVGIDSSDEMLAKARAQIGDERVTFSKGDLAKLRTMVTPEMVGYFSEQLSANASRGVENKVDAVKLEQGDLSESWSEGGIDYASVAMRFSMIDVTRRIADGTVVEGNPQVRTEATEVWTFLRSRGGNWILSAIQQA